MCYRLVAWYQGGGELTTLKLLALAIGVSVLTFVGEAVGLGLAFHVSPLRVLSATLDFSAGIRPGWEILAAGLCVVVVDLARSSWVKRTPRRTRPLAAE
jgi:sulfoxide reductase heme-binding subunit YedZ